MKKIFPLIILFVFFSFLPPSFATVRYVDATTTGCSDPDTDYDPATRTCGTGSAYVSSTINAGLLWVVDLAPDDIVYIRAGTYSERMELGADGVGSAGHNVIVAAYPGETVTVSGTGKTAALYFYADNALHHVTFQGITFSGGTNYAAWMDAGINDITFDGCTFTGSAGFSTTSGGTNTGLIFQDCTFTASSSAGFYAQSILAGSTFLRCNFNANTQFGARFIVDVTTTTFTNCNFRNNGVYGFVGISATPGTSKTGTFTITGGSACYNEDNNIYIKEYDGFIIDGVMVHNGGTGASGGSPGTITEYKHGILLYTCADVIVRNCWIYNHDILAVTENGCDNVVWVNNLLFGILNEFGLYDAEATTANTNCKWINNTVIGTGLTNLDGSQGLINIGDTSTGWVIKNNLLVTTDAGLVVNKQGAAYTMMDMDYNQYWSSAETPFNDGGTGRSFAAWKTESEKDAHSVFSNPNLTANLNMGTGTAGRNAGTCTDNPLCTSGSKIKANCTASIYDNCKWYGSGINIGWGQDPIDLMDGIPGKMWDTAPKYYTVP